MKPAIVGYTTRDYPCDDLRAVDPDDDGPPRITGHAAVFNKLSEPLWAGFRERILPGAFRKTLKEADVAALFNHDPNYVLGRTSSGTLELREDDVGLAFDVTPPPTPWADGLMASIKRGDINGASFGFRVVKDKVHTEGGEGSGKTIRELVEVELFDVSPVTFPAYRQTDVQIRAVLAERGIDWEALEGALIRAGDGGGGAAPAADDHDIIKGAIDALNRCLPTEPPEHRHSEGDEGDPPQPWRLVALRRRLLIAEKALV